MRVRTLIAAGAAVSLATFVAPQAQADAGPAGGGLTCGLVATTDPTAQRDTVTGVVEGGPWVAPEGATADIRCTVQVVYNGMPPQVVGTVQSAPSQVAFLPPIPITFQYVRSAYSHIEVCTEVNIYGNPSYVHQYDADHDPSNGAQCQEATDVGADPSGGDVWVAPPQMDGDYCVYVQHGLPVVPDPYYVCPPGGHIP